MWMTTDSLTNPQVDNFQKKKNSFGNKGMMYTQWKHKD